jgi:hypothetical protein
MIISFEWSIQQTTKSNLKAQKKQIATWSLWNLLGLLHFHFNHSMLCDFSSVPLYVVDFNNARTNGSFTLQLLLS